MAQSRDVHRCWRNELAPNAWGPSQVADKTLTRPGVEPPVGEHGPVDPAGEVAPPVIATLGLAERPQDETGVIARTAAASCRRSGWNRP